MGISKREIIVVGVLLTVLTAVLIYQWWFNPNICWQRTEGQRMAWENMVKQSRVSSLMAHSEGYERFVRRFPDHPQAVSARAIITHTRATLGKYEEILRRFPEHPKAAAARVVIARLEEFLDRHSPRILEVRAGMMKFYGDKQAAAEVEKFLFLKEGWFDNIADESLACIAPRKFARGLSADTVQAGGWEGWIGAYDSKSGKSVTLPFLSTWTPDLIEGAQARQRNLGRIAFATRPHRPVSFIRGVRWTVWVADFKAGRLRAFLPSKPMPDPKKTKKPLLVWSADGKRLTCGGETFVVD